MSLLTENGNTKDDLRLPTDESLLTQVGSNLEIFSPLGLTNISYFFVSIFSDRVCFNGISLQIKDGFAEGKDLVVSVMSAMGEEQICALKDIGPKN